MDDSRLDVIISSMGTELGFYHPPFDPQELVFFLNPSENNLRECKFNPLNSLFEIGLIYEFRDHI